MNSTRHKVPQASLGFRIIAFFTRLQLWYLIRKKNHSQLIMLLFVLVTGATALSIITALAYLINLPMLFPPLGPSAVILFYTPMATAACPRNVILSHTVGVGAGIAALFVFTLIFPAADLWTPSALNWIRVMVIAAATGITSTLMILLNCVHPPAAASALIAAMGYLQQPDQVCGFFAAVILLVVEAYFFNHILGGLPYPLWRTDSRVASNYRKLAEIAKTEATFRHNQIIQQLGHSKIRYPQKK